MWSSHKAKIALALAVLLLGLSGLAAGLVIFRLGRTEALVRHAYDVEVAVGQLESSLTDVGRCRVAYIDSATPESLRAFDDAASNVKPALDRIRLLVSGNPEQEMLWGRLEANSLQRVAASAKSVESRKQNGSNPQEQMQFTSDVARAAFDTASIAQRMKLNEDRLLDQRNRLSSLLFTIILGLLAVSFLFSAAMFWLHYRLLDRELNERKAAEDQLRQLSVQLMQVQDEEHRRFARELHDGLGQNFHAAKMMAESLRNGDTGKSHAAGLAALLGDALAQTRTISYLFHPPLLDEVGFPSAARWLIDGYAKRTGVAVSSDIPEPEHRLPPGVELTLYRVLQEALNNIHHHSKSTKAEVSFEVGPKCVMLRIKDYGQGIPSETLSAFHANGTKTGVGLLSMKERVREQRGELEIRSHETDTEIVVKIPCNGHIEFADKRE